MVTATLYGVHGDQVFTQSATLDVAPDSSDQTAITVPTSSQSDPVCFLALELRDSGGNLLSENFYWLTPQPDAMAAPDPSTAWYIEPIATYADFTALSSLPGVTLRAQKTTQTSGGTSRTTVTLQNPSQDMAFFTRLQVLSGSGDEILPVLWDDNYVSLPPGGSKTLTATYAGDEAASVKVSGYNVAATAL